MKKYIFWKIKPGKKQTWINWCNEIIQHQNEVIETMKEENLIHERCVIFEDYVFYEHETVEGKEKKPMNPNREINQKHQRILNECLEHIEGNIGVIGYDLKITNE
ncbi:MAG: hypothetical protein A3A98_01110 [Candidatus Staskawiczbacteria bacterium RIFCSPLOWO2_01_FULL_40_39]|uniref:Uncharacterized protein n=1 Tax=Candidatus Staskawiczbacteria bacterium RIFCSPHIGHO2_01_FULL_39_25 TaxID=1802202 RepID=A0A1G2HNL1_9BACT|nr:MAG: hypothetical protein A2730_01110 [Candidatus Staskawiczbacteria bacterium RIFCSPHIGHO2_01_FULL_39_25]OGZ73328.1 MAG: hypothetical protein A3A98_01110 [Candidatus Staskawiczbacteria bacterium RIFCSPLOWO2_01_FULL_40_39]OGZ75444.1 MAG: hypothetical protein A3I87_01595 [Candidatus Staskawiczbacteria bacterium RIFCSPLOWO2_02_FULL_39_8]